MCWRASGRGVLGDLRYYADTKIDAFSTPIARAQLAAGLAMLGDKETGGADLRVAPCRRSRRPMRRCRSPSRADYGTQLRDAAAVLALMGESGATTPQLQKAFNIVDEAEGAAEGDDDAGKPLASARGAHARRAEQGPGA